MTVREDTERRIDEAVQQVFEGLLFLEAQHSEAVGELSGKVLEASLSIKGDRGGHLTLQVSAEDSVRLLHALPSGNNLPEEEAVVDLFAELVNTVGGRLAASIAGDSGTFDLSIPVVRYGRSEAGTQDICRKFAMELGAVRFLFRPNLR